MNPRRKFIQAISRGVTGSLLARAIPVGVGALLLPRLAKAGTVLDPTNPFATFQEEGSENITPGSVLSFTDENVGDIAVLHTTDLDAGAGIDLDIVATFHVLTTLPNNVDTGNRVVINDGTHAAIAECVLINDVKGIGLLSQGPPSDPASYPVFVPVDWQTAPCTIRLRRWANGDGELIEVNGAAPAPRALLTADKVAGPTRQGTTVELGCASPEARCIVEYSAFRSERVVAAVAGTLNFTSFRLRDADSADRIRFRADYTLGSGNDGINPSLEPVTIKLMDMFGSQFYPAPDFNPLNGFDVQGKVGKRQWTLNDAERARTGLEQLVIDENPNSRGGIAFRDLRTAVADTDFSKVKVEITIGTGTTADKLTGIANLVEKPFGSGKWRLATEP
jgi:hypothetical protein